jgi:hypothetical protein
VVRHANVVLTVSLADAKTHRVVERITASPEHPFYVRGKGFVPAGRLAVGNAIVTRAGPALVVQTIRQNRRAEGYTVYNFVVEDDHSYFVGTHNGGAWVHNPVGDCIALDTNAIIAAIEGNAADQSAVTAAINGGTPIVSAQAVREFIDGGGDIDALRSFLSANGGRVALSGRSSVISGIEELGTPTGDARILGSAIRENVLLLTRDGRLLRQSFGRGKPF